MLITGAQTTIRSEVIYLDHNATRSIAPKVLEAMLPYLTTEWGNPSSSYKFGAKLKGAIEAAREQIAELIGADGREVLFTSCATESNNAAIHAALKANPDNLDDRALVGCDQVCYLAAGQAKNAMKFELYKDMVLTRDLPTERLKRGDIVKLVEHHPGRSDQEDGYSAEVFNALGDSIAVITVPESSLAPLREDEVCCVRPLVAA